MRLPRDSAAGLELAPPPPPASAAERNALSFICTIPRDGAAKKDYLARIGCGSHPALLSHPDYAEGVRCAAALTPEHAAYFDALPAEKQLLFRQRVANMAAFAQDLEQHVRNAPRPTAEQEQAWYAAGGEQRIKYKPYTAHVRALLWSTLSPDVAEIVIRRREAAGAGASLLGRPAPAAARLPGCL